MRKLILAVAVLSIPVAVTTASLVGSGGATAGASAPPSCTTLSGNLSKALIGACSGGLGTGQIKPTSYTSGTITWHRTVVVHGKSVLELQGTTVVKKFSLMMASTSRCPKGTGEYHLTGRVSADTTHKITIGSQLSADVCFSVKSGEKLRTGTVVKL